MAHELTTNELKEAIIIIDNEAIRLRNEIKKSELDSDKIKQEDLYKLKDTVLEILQKRKLLYTLGYYIQKVNDKEHKLFINKIGSEDDDNIIYSLKRYMSKSQKKKYKVEFIGNISLIEPQKINSELEINEAIQIIEKYIKTTKEEIEKEENKKQQKENDKKPNPNKVNKINKAKQTKKNSYKKEKFIIKETKLVELTKLKVVKGIHINGRLNPITTKEKKKEIIEKVSKNKGEYPKDEAILVHKSKDPEDKRRVVYNIEDGYRRFLLAGEIGLDKVYVNIIDESK